LKPDSLFQGREIKTTQHGVQARRHGECGTQTGLSGPKNGLLRKFSSSADDDLFRLSAIVANPFPGRNFGALCAYLQLLGIARYSIFHHDFARSSISVTMHACHA